MSRLDAAWRGQSVVRAMQACGLKAFEWRERLRKLRIVIRPGAASMLSRRLASGLTTRLRVTKGAALILAYHRIARTDADPQMLSVNPAHFAEQLHVAVARCKVVSLPELARTLTSGGDVSGMLAFTFDDGYADNLLAAKPLLEQHGVPATVFIVSQHIGSSKYFWWDELEQLLLEPERLPQHLHLKLNALSVSWDFGDDAFFPPEQHKRYRAWNVLNAAVPTRRHRIYRALALLLHHQTPAQRDQTLAHLRAWAGAPAQPPARFRAMTQAELLELAASPMITIGAHTANHPALALLDAEHQRSEIAAGKMRLEEIIGRRVDCFAYPYGSLASFDDRSVQLVRSAGFAAACTTFADQVRAGCDPLQLPRMLVRDWNGDEFERHLREWMRH